MPYYFFDWNAGREEHVAEHGISTSEFEEVVMDPVKIERSRSSDPLIAFGWTSTGKHLACVYEMLHDTVYPVTAFEFDE